LLVFEEISGGNGAILKFFLLFLKSKKWAGISERKKKYLGMMFWMVKHSMNMPQIYLHYELFY